MSQEQLRGGNNYEDEEPEYTAPASQENLEKLSDETEALLDEIDDVLEENAEEFVNAYKQKGGQ